MSLRWNRPRPAAAGSPRTQDGPLFLVSNSLQVTLHIISEEKKMANQYACANAGASTCGFRTTWTDEADLRRQIANHLVTVHEVKTPTATIVNYLVKVAKDMSGQVQH
jgi:predicted small metal-binding protein